MGAATSRPRSGCVNPASQIVFNTRSNEAFAQLTPAAGAVASTVDGRNRLTATGGSTVTHDGRGNVSAIGATGYYYTAENRLMGAVSPMFAYDGLGRLYYRNVSGMWWDYDGDRLTAEIDAGTNAILRRWVHGPGVDEPLVQYEGSGTTTRHWLYADERGSIVAQSDSTGAVTAINRYDEYGAPATGNAGRFQYTGQVWLPEAGLYYYRARMYHPHLPRFMQTDPIGYGNGMNLYGYVGGDPVNRSDPTGLKTIVVTGHPLGPRAPSGITGGVIMRSVSAGPGLRELALERRLPPCPPEGAAEDCEIVVTAIVPPPRHGRIGHNRPPLWQRVLGVLRAGAGRVGGVLSLILSLGGDTCHTCTHNWTLGGNHTAQQWANRMRRGGWSNQSISEAVNSGQSFPATNNVNPANGATRHVHPNTGLSVVRDDVTGEIIHLGAPGFRY